MYNSDQKIHTHADGLAHAVENRNSLVHKSGAARAFTLIETMIYLAIYGIIMTGALVSVYALMGSSARNYSKAIVQEEGNFLAGKIDWALTGAYTITTPSTGASGDTMSVSRYDSSAGNPVVIAVSGGNMTIARGSNPAQILNNSNVQVTCPATGCFTHTSGSGSGINPESITASFTVSTLTAEGQAFAQDFSTVKYLRK